jgi:hypothetical protein
VPIASRSGATRGAQPTNGVHPQAPHASQHRFGFSHPSVAPQQLEPAPAFTRGLPTEKLERSFTTSTLPHFGHAAPGAPAFGVKCSKQLLQSLQRYS